jgi:hypothetical protein
MAQSITVKPKRRGRPATGRDPLIGVRLPPELIAALDDRAAVLGISRSEALRRLMELGLEHATGAGTVTKPGE